jgi:ketosteroid isomerase-like protein
VSANLNLVRLICAAWERGDYSSTEWAHPEIELVFADGAPPSSWRGLAGMAEGWRQFLSTWDYFHQEADEYRELDHERVLVFFRFSGRGKTSGLELGAVESRGAGIFHVRGGKVTRFVAYASSERALGDLRLSSETTSADS